MPKDRLEKARFERVSETGDLVFSLGGRQFAVSLDDTLERAILEAKQIRSEQQQPEQPHEQSTLPISQIQSLIRAGADPSRVAERYGLSTTLVRRFSAAVETEKQYAIEQFLTVPAPKDSKVRTINELVERTLAAASIGMESVTWKSTRRGLEPMAYRGDFHFRRTRDPRRMDLEHARQFRGLPEQCRTQAARRAESEDRERRRRKGFAGTCAARRFRPFGAYRACRVCMGRAKAVCSADPSGVLESGDLHRLDASDRSLRLRVHAAGQAFRTGFDRCREYADAAR